MRNGKLDAYKNQLSSHSNMNFFSVCFSHSLNFCTRTSSVSPQPALESPGGFTLPMHTDAYSRKIHQTVQTAGPEQYILRFRFGVFNAYVTPNKVFTLS